MWGFHSSCLVRASSTELAKNGDYDSVDALADARGIMSSNFEKNKPVMFVCGMKLAGTTRCF